jgi:uncharacterized protein (TIGR02147 family)
MEAFYITKIKDDLTTKQRENPHYSLRAYARDIGVHPATLSQILKGKRPLPFKDTPSVVRKLRLDDKERTRFMESVLRTKTNIDDIKIQALDDRYIVDASHFCIIAEWEHYVVLDLFDVASFEATSAEIAARLAISQHRADIVINNLLTAGLVVRKLDGTLKKVHDDVKTTEDITSQALRESHLETLKMGMEKLDDIDVELRDFSSASFAIDTEKIPEAKTIIREFRMKMAALMKGGEKTDVYQLAIQFYPMTTTKKQKN